MDRKEWRKCIEIAWSDLSAQEEQTIIEAIEKHWEQLNLNIDNVFSGKKVRIMKLK